MVRKCIKIRIEKKKKMGLQNTYRLTKCSSEKTNPSRSDKADDAGGLLDSFL